MTMLGDEEINRRLGYHPATETTIPMFEDNRARFVELARHLDETLPPGREAALAQTALQEALQWANAAVACNLAQLEDPAGRTPNLLVPRTVDRVGRPLPVHRIPACSHGPDAIPGRVPMSSKGPDAIPGPPNPPRAPHDRPYA